MAFDGITIAALTSELNHTLLGGRVYKIAQPETDELLLTIKTGSGQYRLLLSADASLPLVYLTAAAQASPECPHCENYPAGTGTLHPHHHGTSG